jgi:hypothetical protein
MPAAIVDFFIELSCIVKQQFVNALLLAY